MPTAVGSYLQKNPAEKEPFFGLLADATERVGSAKPVENALRELALHVDRVRNSVTTYLQPILRRHIGIYREEVRRHIRHLGRLKKTYGEKYVEEFQDYLRSNWPQLSPSQRSAEGIKRWLRQRKGESPGKVRQRVQEHRQRKREESRKARGEFLTAARRKLHGGAPRKG